MRTSEMTDKALLTWRLAEGHQIRPNDNATWQKTDLIRPMCMIFGKGRLEAPDGLLK